MWTIADISAPPPPGPDKLYRPTSVAVFADIVKAKGSIRVYMLVTRLEFVIMKLEVEKFIVPSTSKVLAGSEVLMPTLPSSEMKNLSTLSSSFIILNPEFAAIDQFSAVLN
jgi:hypothetical protein